MDAPVPVEDVGLSRQEAAWPTLLAAIEQASFVALDCELSGLGDRKALNARSIEDRYAVMKEVSKSRAVLSLGVSCFQNTPPSAPPPDPSSDQSALEFTVRSFNIWLLCSDPYVVEPRSMRFLVRHGFDFNTQCAEGISYYKGPDRDETPARTDPLRRLMTALVLSGRPIVLHNGLVDMIFLYESLWAPLPPTLASFLADVSEMFPGGVYDTKYIVEFEARFPASFLEYVFRRCQRDNSSAGLRVTVQHPVYPVGAAVQYLAGGGMPATGERRQVCTMYADYGFCTAGNAGVQCDLSHNIDWILDNERATGERRRVKNVKKAERRRKRQSSVERIDCDEGSGADISVEMADNMDDVHMTDGVTSENSSMDAITPENKPMDATTSGKKRVKAAEGRDALESKANGESEADSVKTANGTDTDDADTAGGHSAGYDAYMTGYIFACFTTRFGQTADDSAAFTDFDMGAFRNKVALMGKDVPLIVSKSSFSKPSKDGRKKLESVQTLRK